MSEEGALEPMVAFLVTLLLASAVALTLVLGILARHEQARSAADFAALAAASTSDCSMAKAAAARNAGTLLDCVMGGDGVRVRVSVPTNLPQGLIRAGAPSFITASAHAIV